MQPGDITRTILVDGVARSRVNSLAQAIDPTDDGLIQFWRWFGNSKAVDDQGRPLVHYHGTNAMAYSPGQTIEVFHTHNRGGAYFSSSEKIAGQYGQEIYAAYLNLQNPLIIHADGSAWNGIDGNAVIKSDVTEEVRHEKKKLRTQVDTILAELYGEPVAEPKSSVPDPVFAKVSDLPGMDGRQLETDDLARFARRHGFDGLIVREVLDSPTHDRLLYQRTLSDVLVTFKPAQIKSPDNYGRWEPDNSYYRSADADKADYFTASKAKQFLSEIDGHKGATPKIA